MMVYDQNTCFIKICFSVFFGGGGPDWSDIRGAEASKKQNNKNKSEDPSGSVRDTTHHLIHDSKTSTPVPCIVFHEGSDGYDPRSI